MASQEPTCHSSNLPLNACYDIQRIREGVVHDILRLVDDWQDHTRQWMSERPTSVRKTFNMPGKDKPTQAPLILYLMDQLGYPDVYNLTADFENGFDMVGDIRRRPGLLDGDRGRTTNTKTP